MRFVDPSTLAEGMAQMVSPTALRLSLNPKLYARKKGSFKVEGLSRIRKQQFDAFVNHLSFGPRGQLIALAQHATGKSAPRDYSDMRALGHPYGHGAVGPRGPRGKMPMEPYRSHRRSGSVHEGWRIRITRHGVARTDVLITIENVSPHFKYLRSGTRGTTRMVPRPIRHFMLVNGTRIVKASFKSALKLGYMRPPAGTPFIFGTKEL